MGQAKLRGTFEERKAQAIAAGRLTEVRRKMQSARRAGKSSALKDYLRFLTELCLKPK